MKTLLYLRLSVLGWAMMGTPVVASSIQYLTTSLGPSFQYETNPAGQITGVTNATGTATYAFDKSPTIRTDTPATFQSGPDQGGWVIPYDSVTLKNGGFVVGVTPIFIAEVGFGLQPGFLSASYGVNDNGWFSGNPISDMNKLGQVVGDGGGYAAFSAIGAQSPGFPYNGFDDLNNYIAKTPGVTLISAFKIDDLGRILALGSDNMDYLLTPVALGGAEQVPEPTTLAIWAMASAVLIRRAVRRSRLDAAQQRPDA